MPGLGPSLYRPLTLARPSLSSPIPSDLAIGMPPQSFAWTLARHLPSDSAACALARSPATTDDRALGLLSSRCDSYAVDRLEIDVHQMVPVRMIGRWGQNDLPLFA